MRYYLLRRGGEFVVFRVKGNDILDFLQRHEHEILLESKFADAIVDPVRAGVFVQYGVSP